MDYTILFGLLAMFGFGVSGTMSQVPSRLIGVRKTVFYRGVVISAILGIALIVSLKDISFLPSYIFLAIIISIIGYLPLATYYKALQLGKVGVITPITSSSVIFTVFFSIVFFGERLNVLQSFSIILIVIGIVLISVKFRQFRSSHLFRVSSGVPFALITCLLWGLLFFLYKIPVTTIGPILSAFILEFGITLISALHLIVSGRGFGINKSGVVLSLIFIGVLGSMGTLFYNLGIEHGDVSIVAAITLSNPLVAALYGKVVYKERLSLQQYIAGFFIVLGVVLLSV